MIFIFFKILSIFQDLLLKIWKWFKKCGSPPNFYRLSGRWLPWLAGFALIFLLSGVIWGLFFAPPDHQQGDSFRIIYVHVPAATLAELCYILMAVSGAVFLIWQIKLADVLATVGAPIGAVFTIMALVTGAIWGKPTWGAWWVWDARIISVLLLLFLYLGVIVLRQAIPNQIASARACAILLIVGVVNIPIIKYSVDWWYTLHQGATFTLTSMPAMQASMYVPLIFTILGFYSFFMIVLLLGMRAELISRERYTSWVQALVTDNR